MKISISGSGTTIVFIHGFCETLRIWEPFETQLKENFRVVLIDLPGHGDSELQSENFTIDDIADQIYEELCANGIDEYFVIGHSLGGYVSLALAELYPNNVLGVGLFSSTIFADDDEKKKVRDKIKGFIDEHGVELFIDSFVPNLFTPENRTKYAKEIDLLKEEGNKTSAESIIAYSRAMKNRPDRSRLLSDTSKPVFVIAGERDMAVRLDVSKEMIQLIQHGDSIILQGAGHNGFLENQTESLSFIDGFLRKYLA